ncbi:FadR/GntR family transcriptional regulator [Galbitalea sp. SE-J8]|uniref:FadR/GntR family transcriptional regulator n=1 Tax=Galbitalea sp. SE-J8 TaxID=3054952 RepID=UPI00259CCABA|nr:FadR/GntR family transcriptional regulator [Galbitalea sp. SE-J8]MDM4761554.1 FadR/GntR family transcriptional regulator [Galbitalea sp. SE-J8]
MARGELDITAVSRPGSLYQDVSGQLVDAIRRSGLEPGTRIPSERELGERFGVSRTVIREATRHLAAKGVLQVVTGYGVIVADVDESHVRESFDLYVSQRDEIDPDRIFEVRETLEVRMVALAARRATDDQLRRIADVCESMADVLDDAGAASAADVAFHRAIAEASDNPLFPLLVDSLGTVLYRIRRATLNAPGRGEIALEAHRRIARALTARDESAAVAAMREHLEDSRRALARAIEAGGATAS